MSTADTGAADKAKDAGKGGGAPPADGKSPAPALSERIETLRLRLGFWQAIWVTILTSGVAVAIPAGVELLKIDAETRLKTEEARVAAINAQTANVTALLDNALNQDIEIRIRFADYLAHVSHADYVKQWAAYAEVLTGRRNDIRTKIVDREQQLFKLETLQDPSIEDQLLMASLRRELDWAYAEFGYAAQDTNITIPQAAQPVATDVTRSTSFSALAPEYTTRFATMEIRPDRRDEVSKRVDAMLANKPRYDAVELATGVPWYLVAAIHHLESSGNFSRHLANGDPLAGRTIQSPAGIPATGTPPFTWEEGAIAAIEHYGMSGWADWSLSHVLFRAEAMNGFGYRTRGLPTPYLWGCTNQYTAGKYIADGVFSPATVSQQCGVAAYLRELQDRGVIQLSSPPPSAS